MGSMILLFIHPTMLNIPQKMSSNPLVSIITINYNNLQVTLELLQSIEECIYKNLQVIVVDNGSVEDPTNDIKNKFPKEWKPRRITSS